MIFLSHKSDPNHEHALLIKSKLEEQGYQCWLAPECVSPGGDFAEEVPQAINLCEMFILILSKETSKSSHVRKEIIMAINHKKYIIPLKIEDFDMDDTLTYLLANIQVEPFGFTDDDFKWLFEKCKLGEKYVVIEISKNPSRTISIMKDDFQLNMLKFIEERPEELGKTVFAMGIDCSSILNISTTQGIIKHVCEFLLSEYGITTSYLQELINNAKIEQLHHKSPYMEMKYKDIVIIKVPIPKKNQPTKHNILNLLLIANSRKSSTYSISKNVDDVEGIDSREIVIEIFNKVIEISDEFSNLFIGAMGTNGLKFPYEVITSEILNCYIHAYRCECGPRHLFYSVRDTDMKKAGITTHEIFSYISAVVKFIKQKD
ncbi:MAG: toll/interleukin-1 receptor domain-containing protein [Clostridia bacterium]|nr:toll/interleukin-1 receptor domain-containing protein [Clostridia bacterium]